MGKFEITKRKNGEFQFNLKASNGQVILTSEGYTTKENCKNGVESVKKNSPLDERYDRLVAKNGKPYFNLKATNGQIIGTSEQYESVASRDNGIESVKKNAPDASVDDLTIVK
ncbi:MAG: YegP family protein [Dysgonomonas sp.]